MTKDLSGINKKAKHPSTDTTSYVLHTYYEYCSDYQTSVMHLDYLTQHYLIDGPAHSLRQPFPSEADLIAALLWLHKNNILYISVDNKISNDVKLLDVGKVSTPRLYRAIQKLSLAFMDDITYKMMHAA